QGRIEGKVEVKEILVLKQSAIIQGDISTRKLVVEEGAIFDGRIEMGAPKNKSIHTNKDETSIQKQAV
ncbi:MAG: polymer-forming cytoskeletal protein, partial [Chitinophagales bacterium]|nr:polymer-forming cytoskeletal protein [Chitinophagales bacterium]